MTQEEEPIRARISPLLVAEELLNQRAQRGEVSLTPLQLIKMVYLCQGWMLGVKNIILFEEDIEAWQYGPVIPSIYYAYRGSGKQPIPKEHIKAYPIEENTEKAINAEYKDLLKNVVKLVLDMYGKLTGPQLSSLTHQEGTPWYKTYDTNLRNQTIDKLEIREHFQALAKKYSKNN